MYYLPQQSLSVSMQNMVIFTARNEVLQGYVFTRVCDYVHRGGGVSASVHARIHPPLGADTTPPPLLADTPREQTPQREQCMLGDTGNKRAVRILLGCILFSHISS